MSSEGDINMPEGVHRPPPGRSSSTPGSVCCPALRVAAGDPADGAVEWPRSLFLYSSLHRAHSPTPWQACLLQTPDSQVQSSCTVCLHRLPSPLMTEQVVRLSLFLFPPPPLLLAPASVSASAAASARRFALSVRDMSLSILS